MRMDFIKHRLANFNSGLGLKVVQIVQSERHARKRRRDRRFAGVGIVQFSVHQIVVDLGVKR